MRIFIPFLFLFFCAGSPVFAYALHQPSPDALSGLEESGLIAYLGPDSNIWVADSSGELKKQLTFGGEASRLKGIYWAPDGSKLLFHGSAVINDRVEKTIWVMDADGGNLVQVSNYSFGGDRSVSWSPNGHEFAYIAPANSAPAEESNFETEIFIYDTFTGETREATRTRGLKKSLDWSPDGRQIAFMEIDLDIGSAGVQVVDLNTSQSTWITEVPDASDVQWDASGSHIYVIGYSQVEVIVDLVTNTEVIEPDVFDGINYQFAYSPDGSKTAYSCHSRESICVADSEGRSSRVISSLGGFPSWSPDGKEIAFSGGSTVNVITENGGELREIAVGSFAAWQPAESSSSIVDSGELSNDEEVSSVPPMEKGENGLGGDEFLLAESEHIHDIEYLSTTDAWAVGSKDDGTGLILHWDGSKWRYVDNPASDVLSAIDFVTPTDGWAVGRCNIILHWDGIDWSLWQGSQCSGAFVQGLDDISMHSSNEGWAVGSGNQASAGVAYRWDGFTWQSYILPNYPNSVSTIDSSSAWLSRYWLMEWDGSQWIDHMEIEGVRDLWVTAQDGWAVGDKTYRWNGEFWEPYGFPSDNELRNLEMSSIDEGWLVERKPEEFCFWLWQGAEWSRLDCITISETTRNVSAISNIEAGEGWISLYGYSDDGPFQYRLVRVHVDQFHIIDNEQVSPLTADVEAVLTDKSDAIDFLSSPPVQVLGLSMTPPDGEYWGYNEEQARKLLSQVKTDYARYQANAMDTEERAAFEEQAEAFARLTLVEQGMVELYPQAAQMAYSWADSTINFMATSVSLALKLDRAFKLLAANAPVGGDIIAKIGAEAAEEAVDIADHSLDLVENRIENDDMREGFQSMRRLAGPTILLDTNAGAALENFLVDIPLKGAASGLLLKSYFAETQPIIDLAVNSADPEFQGVDYVFVSSNFDRAQLRVEEVVEKTRIQTEFEHQRHEAFTDAATSMNLAADAGDLASLTFVGAPIGQLTARVADLFALLVDAYDGGTIAGHMGEIIYRANQLPYVSFDAASQPISQNGKSKSALFSLAPSANWDPASASFMRQDQPTEGDPTYEQAINEVLEAIRSEDTVALEEAASKMLEADDELDAQIAIAQHRLQSSSDLVQGQEADTLLAARQELSQHSVIFYGYLVENLLDLGNPESIAQIELEAPQLLEAVSEASQIAGVVAQSTDMPPSVLVSDYDLPGYIAEGEPFVLSITLTNAGAASADSTTVQIQGAEELPIDEMVELGVIDPLTSRVVELTLKPKIAGASLLEVIVFTDDKISDTKNLVFEVDTRSSERDRDVVEVLSGDDDVEEQQISDTDPAKQPPNSRTPWGLFFIGILVLLVAGAASIFIFVRRGH